MSAPVPDDENAALRAALQRDAARIQEPPLDVTLHRETMRRIRSLKAVREPSWIIWWRPALACAVVLLGFALWLPHGSSPSHPDLERALASAESAVANLSPDVSSPMPSWMSPTASLLDVSHTSISNPRFQP